MVDTHLSDDDLLLLDDLRLQRPFIIYQRVLKGVIDSSLNQLRKRVGSEEEKAVHNELVGFVNGLQKAVNVIDFLVEQYDIDQIKNKKKG